MLVFTLKAFLCLWFASQQIPEILGKVEPLAYLPSDLQSYLDTCRSSGDLSQQSAKLIFWTAMNQYTAKFVKTMPNLSPQQNAYLEYHLREALAPIYSDGNGNRGKRQAIGGARRIRKEVRAMTLDERRRYFSAVNAMKNDRSLPPNVYDFLASYHQGDNVQRAHFGPAFPSWHRLYLWIFEHFLRLQDPTASIPYWASVLDDDMQDSSQSVIWSPGFYGNGDGEIRTGPFQNWPQINFQTRFTRNVQGGRILTFAGINNILRRRRNAEILVPTAFPDSNLDLQHGAGHGFVGGTMNNLNAAARDPIFFSHHAFVDQIWERFRSNQQVNPETDYPFDPNDPRFRPSHSPTATAGFTGLPVTEGWIQRDGYRNIFSTLVAYEPLPSCPNCANSPYLFCNQNLNPPRCVSRTIGEMAGTFYVNDIGLLNVTTGSQGMEPPVRTITLPRNNSLDVCPRRTYINDIDTKTSRTYDSRTGAERDEWSYISVKVVTKRPVEYDKFNKYSVHNQVAHSHQGLKEELVKPGVQKPYESCNKLQDVVGKISVVAYGLNYDGYAEEYVLVDNRLGVAEGNAYLPVKKPTGVKPSEVIIAAFDSCGRVCKPFCKHGSTGGIYSEKVFSGGIKVSGETPLQYSNSYSEAIMDVWSVSSASSCPKVDDDKICVSFFCDFTDPWIWSQDNSIPSARPGKVAGEAWIPNHDNSVNYRRPDQRIMYGGTGNDVPYGSLSKTVPYGGSSQSVPYGGLEKRVPYVGGPDKYLPYAGPDKRVPYPGPNNRVPYDGPSKSIPHDGPGKGIQYNQRYNNVPNISTGSTIPYGGSDNSALYGGQGQNDLYYSPDKTIQYGGQGKLASYARTGTSDQYRDSSVPYDGQDKNAPYDRSGAPAPYNSPDTTSAYNGRDNTIAYGGSNRMVLMVNEDKVSPYRRRTITDPYDSQGNSTSYSGPEPSHSYERSDNAKGGQYMLANGGGQSTVYLDGHSIGSVAPINPSNGHVQRPEYVDGQSKGYVNEHNNKNGNSDDSSNGRQYNRGHVEPYGGSTTSADSAQHMDVYQSGGNTQYRSNSDN